jgi:hypothetical protein
MNTAALLSLIIVCIFATACVAETGEHNTTMTPAPAPLINVTASPPPTTTALQGMLTISVAGWRGEFPASVDTTSVGVVTTDKPLVLMIDEGYHTVEICCGSRCEQSEVDIRFGKQQTVDFSEQLQRDLVFIEPTVRITGYRVDGDQMAIDVEFINPTQTPLVLSADVTCGYSYIQSMGYTRLTSLVESHPSATLNACDRVTKTLNFNLTSGYGYTYDNFPSVTNVTSR